MLLADLGEQFAHSQNIAGLVLKLKPTFDKIAIWLQNDHTPEIIESVKQDMIKICAVSEKDIEFMDF